MPTSRARPPGCSTALAFTCSPEGSRRRPGRCWTRALTIDEAAHGPEHPAVATSLGNLALVLRDLGEPAAARPLLDRALTITEAAHGPEHPTVAISLGNLAAVLRDLGEPAAARPLLDRALTIGEAAHGPEHPTCPLFDACSSSSGAR
jgi:Tetratricopeptide repeat